MIINVTELPRRTCDININGQTMSLGGCAFNVQNMIRLFQIPNVFCSPVGTGMYGDYVAKELDDIGIKPFVRIPDKDNGCCYCFIEPDGERTFLSYHGVEYTFDPSWLEDIDINDFDSVYVCGLEIEEPTGDAIISLLKMNQQLAIYFAPGPRFHFIEKRKLKELFKLSPLIHLNKEEILSFSGADTLKEAAENLFAQTQNHLIVTDGEQGSYYYDGIKLNYVPGIAAHVTDTIGAGDSHFGAFIASRKLGYSYMESLTIANQLAAKVVEIKGSILPTIIFEEWKKTSIYCGEDDVKH